ncbi:MAG: hypothetical protein WBP42_03230 [Candidatus Zixiibacteriota bacterium]
MLERTSLLMVVICLIANFADAQIIPKSFTLKAHPINETKSFLLTEFYVNRQFEHYNLPNRNDWETGAVVGWELGYMRNLNQHWAIGASAFFNGADDRAQLGIKPRVRYWLGKETSLDLAAGPVLFTLDDDSHSNIGIASHLGVNASSWLAFTIAMEYSHFKGTGFPYTRPERTPISVNRTTISAGARVGAVPGIVVGTVGPIVALLFAFIFINPQVDQF